MISILLNICIIFRYCFTKQTKGYILVKETNEEHPRGTKFCTFVIEVSSNRHLDHLFYAQSDNKNAKIYHL